MNRSYRFVIYVVLGLQELDATGVQHPVLQRSASARGEDQSRREKEYESNLKEAGLAVQSVLAPLLVMKLARHVSERACRNQENREFMSEDELSPLVAVVQLELRKAG